MNNLSIFWGHKNSDSFSWHIDPSVASDSVAVPLIESRVLLKADLAVMADMASQFNVRLILDSRDVHLNSVVMPNKAQRHLRKAVPYMVEEQLAEPVDKTFIAVGARTSNGSIPVRALNLAYFSEIMQQFSDADIKLKSVVTEIDLLEQPEEGYQLVLQADKILVKNDSGNHWYCDPDDFAWLVQKEIAETSAEDEMPIAIPMQVVTDSEDRFRLFESTLPVGRFAPQLQLEVSITEFMHKAKTSATNLMQGEFEAKAERSPYAALIVKLGSLAGLLLFAFIAYQGTQWFTLEQQKQILGKQRAALWKQAFPGRRVPSNPDKALSSYLKTLSGGDGQTSFLGMLDSTSSKIADLESLYPTNISYDASRNELRMDVIAKDLSILNQYRDRLRESGHQVEMSSATQRGDGYSSRLIVRK
ncbi:type II secretion system protein GspL [Aliikangiella sp. IMCC44653]